MSKALHLPTEAAALHLGTAMGLDCLRRAVNTVRDQAMSGPDALPLEVQSAFELLLLRAEHLADNPPAERDAYELEWFRIAAVASMGAARLGDADSEFNRVMRYYAEALELFASLPDCWEGLRHTMGAGS